MSSQFDDLLGDFGDSSNTATSGKVTTNGDSGLLLDLGLDSQSPNGSLSANPLYDLDAHNDFQLNGKQTSPSTNPLYDFEDHVNTTQEQQPQTPPSSNPLYDLDSEFSTNHNDETNTTTQPSDNPLYDFSNDTQSPVKDSDPFGDFQDLGTTTSAPSTRESNDVDLLSGGVDNTSSDHKGATADLLGDFTTSEENTLVQPQPSLIDDEEGVVEADSGIHVEAHSTVEDNGNNSFVDDFNSGVTNSEEDQLLEADLTEDSEPNKTTLLDEEQNTEIEEQTFQQESSVDQWPKEDLSRHTEIIKEPPKQENEMHTYHPVVEQTPPVANNVEAVEDDDDDDEEEGVYENEPVKRDDVVREADKSEDVNLPSPGLAQNLLARFTSGQASNSTPREKREITPPNPTAGGGEYVSEPRTVIERYEGKAEAGVFESEPQNNPEVIRSDSHLEDALPEQGSAKKFAARYQQIDVERKTTVMTSKKERTPDRSTGPVEYVSEPRGFVERYEGKAESGVFESQPEEIPDVVKSGGGAANDTVPEKGTAKNLAQRFHQISVENASPVSSSRSKRELTPDSSGRTEYVSEPTQHVEVYESRTDSGVFENTPQQDPDVVKSDTAADEYVPERGTTKNVLAKFKELESTAKSPPLSPGRRKEFTPPRENRSSGVYESTPEIKPDVVTSGDSQQETLPGAGTARSLAQRYKEIEAQSKNVVTSKPRKEITPPPQGGGIYENTPDKFQADYNKPAESGIVENQPTPQREDVARGDSEHHPEVELPEAGSAKNLVNRWRQIESESAKNTSPGSTGVRHKEFTPPREEPRIAQNSKSPRTPKSPAADSNAQLDNGSVHPSELPGQYQPQNEPSVFESTPESRPEALRESDTDPNLGMPKKNQAKKMLARFQSIQAKANEEQPKPIPRRQTEPDNENSSQTEVVDPAMEAARLKFESPDEVTRSKSMKAAINVEKCGACEKTVYAMERLEMNKRVYHKSCFRCSQCKTVLTPKTFAINNEIIFCTTHYKQNFTTKGNYDEGFGRQQHKQQWKPSQSGATPTTATSGESS